MLGQLSRAKLASRQLCSWAAESKCLQGNRASPGIRLTYDLTVQQTTIAQQAARWRNTLCL